MKTRSGELGTFLNVDVEVRGRKSLKSIAEEVEHLGGVVLYCGKVRDLYLLTFEAGLFRKSPTPDRTIHDLCDLIEKFSGQAAKDWLTARSRIFDVGFDAVVKKKANLSMILATPKISTQALARIVKVAGSIAVSCYQGDLNPKSP